MFKSVYFDVVGKERLNCQNCEQRVERVLKGLNGVSQVRAQAQNQRIEVLFNTAVLDASTIAQNLRQAGYETKVAGPESEKLE